MKIRAEYLLLTVIMTIFLIVAEAQNVAKFQQLATKDVSLEDMWVNYQFFPKRITGITSMKDGRHYTTLEGGKICKYSYETGELVAVLLDQNDLNISPVALPENFPDPEFDEDGNEVEADIKINIQAYNFSSDEAYILISTETESIYRYSSRSRNYVYQLSNQQLIPVAKGKKQQLASFSPDSKLLAYVRDNNIFIYNIENDTEKAITTDGEINKILNGIPDWVYEEEFSFAKAFEWSPDGNKIAFLRFDESSVKEWSMTMYGELYPEEYRYKYPKAGEDNSAVSVHVYDLSSGKTISMDVGDEKDQYIPRIKWTSEPALLSIIRLNRLQNKMEILFADALSGKSRVVYTEENKYYIDISDNLHFLKDNAFILTSEKDGYNHIYIFDRNGKQRIQLTKGKWDVSDVAGIDEANATVYYISSEISPLQRDLWSLAFNGRSKKRLSSGDGTNNVNFSTTYTYAINTFSNTQTPPVYTVMDAKGKVIRTIEDNTQLLERMKDYRFSKKEFFTIKTEDGIELNSWMIKPLNFDKNKKYPLFMTCYGGPGSNTVNNRWEYNDLWYQHLASKGYIVVSVDNRGTGNRGEEFKKMTYLQLGKYETIDQIAAARHLSKLDYIDEDRIGIYGWSYGGYLSSLCLLKGAEVFKLAIAVAPVTNWRFYDNIYTERFMRKPQDNADGYDDNSPINFVQNLKGKYLIIHGSADDNVHIENTLEMVKALNDANKQFDMHIYPNKNHSIFGGMARFHIFSRMTNFIVENL